MLANSTLITTWPGPATGSATSASRQLTRLAEPAQQQPHASRPSPRRGHEPERIAPDRWQSNGAIRSDRRLPCSRGHPSRPAGRSRAQRPARAEPRPGPWSPRYGPDASVAAIAELAGVGIGSLYRRYGSKADLLRQLCTLAMQDTIRAAEDALAEADPWTGLAGYIQAVRGPAHRDARCAGGLDRDHAGDVGDQQAQPRPAGPAGQARPAGRARCDRTSPRWTSPG